MHRSEPMERQYIFDLLTRMDERQLIYSRLNPELLPLETLVSKGEFVYRVWNYLPHF